MRRRPILRRAAIVGRILTTVVFTGGTAFAVIPPLTEARAPIPSLGELRAMCGTFRPIHLPDGRALCTHGADPAPPGVDSRVPRPLVPGRAEGLIFTDPPGGAPSKAAAAPGIGCYGNGQDGNRVEAVYAFPADHPDRYAQVVPSIRQWAAETDAVFQTSAAQTGGTRRIRFVTDTNCNLAVTRVPLDAAADDTFDATIAALSAQGYNKSNRKYLVWMDSTELCGIATYYADNRASTTDNFNNGRSGVPGSVARIDAGCWGLGSRGQSVEAHELMHSLGAVMPDAPHGTANGHCSDDDDRMCYADGSPGLVLQNVCPEDEEALLDCRHDDYFSTSPQAGNYLATHWNGASNSFLTSAFSSPTISVADAVTTEGDSGTTPLSFAVTLTTPDSKPVSVSFATVDGSARAPDDYQATSGTLTFNPGETAKTINVAVIGDKLNETDETLSLVLSTPANGLLGRAQAFGTIVDNEESPQGYWFVAADGGIFAFGDAKFFGSTGNLKLNKPIVGMATSPSGNGYWLVASDGGIFAFGDAKFFGSTGNLKLNQPIVGMTSTPSGNGYWFVARDGGIFAFGDARFFGAANKPAQPIVGMAATPSGNGYWCVGRDGSVYAFGDAGFFGSPSNASQIAGLVPSRSGKGYWVAGADGAVSAFGDARGFGSIGNLAQPVVGLAATPKGGGYWLVARDGGIFSFGDARFYGSTGNIKLNQPIVGMTATAAL